MAHKKEEYKAELYGDEVREKLEEFAEKGWDSIPEDEREKWFSRFKFWGVFHHRGGQESYFMMRLTNCGGVLEPDQLRAIGEVARDYAKGPAENPEFGNGWIDLTTRQSIQLHWLKLEDIPEIWEKLEAVGVSSRSAGGDTMRNISGCPVAGKAEEYVESRPILDEIQETIRDDNDLANMPRKFNISVTGCKQGCAQDSINDIGLEPAHKIIAGEEVEGFNVRVGGGLGGREPREAVRSTCSFGPNTPSRPCGPSSSTTTKRATARTARRTALGFSSTNTVPTPSGRNSTNGLISSSKPPGPTSAGSTRTTPASTRSTVPTTTSASTTRKTTRTTSASRCRSADSPPRTPSNSRISPTLRLRRGATDPPAEPAHHGRPRRESLEPPQRAAAGETLARAEPVRSGAMACTGTEFCSLALTETKARMARLLRWLGDNVDVPDDVDRIKMHFSGCTADCGQAMTADIGLQGMRARKDGQMVEAVDVASAAASARSRRSSSGSASASLLTRCRA